MWIHELTGWPDFSWDHQELTVKLAEIRHQQGRLLGRMEALGFELQLEAGLKALTNDVITSSAIEGETLAVDDVRSSIARRLSIDVAGLKPVKREVEGIVEVMLDATQGFRKPLTKTRVCAWQTNLFPAGRSGLRGVTIGSWRTPEDGPMQVVSGPFGREKVHFEAPHAERLESEMSAFLQWFNTNEQLDPVLKAAIAHFWFVTIHPFDDGNGRIARAIADMSLARADGIAMRFYSMSTEIERSRKQYYRILEQQQKGELDITSWLIWFLDCLGRALHGAEDLLTATIFKAELWQYINMESVNMRQQLIINRLLDNFQGHMNTSKYASFAKCSPDTALRDIKDLTSKKILIQNPGAGRSTSYRLLTPAELKTLLAEN